MKATLIVLSTLMLVGGGSVWNVTSNEPTGSQTCLAPSGSEALANPELSQDPDDDLAAKARQAFMRGKLAANQKIVEGLTVKNFEMVAEGAAQTKALVKGQHWFVLDTPEYKKLSEEMEVAATRLEEAARAKNIDSAALRYFTVTLSCLDCHTYLEGKRY